MRNFLEKMFVRRLLIFIFARFSMAGLKIICEKILTIIYNFLSFFSKRRKLCFNV